MCELNNRMKLVVLIACMLFTHVLLANKHIPVIHATSKSVDIKDGDELIKNAWTLTPEANPDVYVSDRTRDKKYVIFYTDIDSIKVKVIPGTVFNFIILLNGKDSCFTQIKSAIPKRDMSDQMQLKNDTIPFILTSRNAIHVKAILNETDTLNLHLDIGSSEIRITRDAILQKTHLLDHQAEIIAGTMKPDYSKLKKVNKIQLGSMLLNTPLTLPTGHTARDMDGRFGWNLFEGKILEINYDQHLLIVHSALPRKLKGYVKSKIEFNRGFVCIQGNFLIHDKKCKGTFLLDTGSDQAVLLDSAWCVKQQFPTGLETIRSSEVTDPRGIVYHTRVVRAPLFYLNGFELTNIPVYLFGSDNPLGFEMNLIGNDLFKRFNVIFDFKRDVIYLKPNSFTRAPYL